MTAEARAPSRAPEFPSTEILTGFDAVADRFDLALCDVWGVLHDGIAAFPAAGDALRRFREGGGRVILVSNAPRPGPVVAGQLDEFGVPRAAYDDIVTSGDLTRAMVAERGARPVHHIGPDRDLSLFAGLPARFSPLTEAEYVVCTGLVDDERETVEDYRAALAEMGRRGLPMICANPDLVVERGHRLILCAGALAAAFEELGGAVVMPGKPHPPIYEEAIRRGSGLLGRAPERARVVAIGDAIRTDVAGGQAAGLATLLIARGIHALELGLPSPGGLDPVVVERFLAAQAVAPTLVAAELTWT